MAQIDASVLSAVVTRDGTLLAIQLSEVPTAIPTAPIHVYVGATTYQIPPTQVILPGYAAIILMLPVRLAATDVVAVNIAANMVPIKGGFVVASSIAVVNRVGRDLADMDMSKIEMAIGTNAPDVSDWSITPIFNDLGKHLSGWSADKGVTQAVDADGNLASLAGGRTCAMYRCDVVNNMVGTPAGYDSIPSGDWTLVYDDPNPRIKGQTTVSTTLSVQPAPGTNYGSIFLQAYAPIHDVRLYPPGADRSQKFSPYFIDKIAGASCIRWMDAWGTNGCGLVTTADVHSPADSTYATGKGRPIAGEIVAVGPFADPQHCFQAGGDWTHAEFRTATPHGLTDGRVVTLGGGLPPLALASGKTCNPSNAPCSVIALDPHTFAASLWTGSEHDEFLAAPASIPFSTHCPPTIPIEDVVELHNLTGSDLWLNVPTLFTDAACVQLFIYLRDHLNPSLRVHVEYGNEHWNFETGFFSYWHCRTQAAKLGLKISEWYTLRSGQIHAIAGPSLGDRLIRTFGSWYSNPETTEAVVKYAQAHAIPVDEIAVAPYLDNLPDLPAMGPLCDTLTIERQMDLFEVSIHFGEQTKCLPAHLAAIKAAYPSANLVCYEGGPEQNRLGTTTLDVARRTRAWAVDPLMYNCYLAYLMKLQEAGVTLAVDYTLANPEPAAWGKWLAWDQRRGTGRATAPGEHDNRADPYSAKVQAVIPYAQKQWSDCRKRNAKTASPA